jgi:DNA-binding CsgD family transcriptional regulator
MNLTTQLTRKELEVLNLARLGYSNKIIADKLVVAITTVKTHRKNIMQKLGITGKAEMTRYLLNLPPPLLNIKNYKNIILKSYLGRMRTIKYLFSFAMYLQVLVNTEKPLIE